MSKQDRQGVRTPADIERKYNLGDIGNSTVDLIKHATKLEQLSQTLTQFIANTNAKFEDLGEDDKMWFYSGEPTLENYPAVEWTTDELKAKHIGDMYYDVDNGDMYLFKSNDGIYAWESCFGDGVDYDTAYKEGYEVGETTGYNNGYTEGAASVPNPLEYAISVANIFSQVAFTDGYNLTIALPNCTAFTYFCYLSTGLKTVTLKEFKEDFALAMAYAFRNCTSLEMIDFGNKTIKIGVGTDTFRGTTILKEIKGILDLTECTNVNNMFEACNSLEEVRFKANSIKRSISFAKCPKLSSETVQSIIDGLATVETAQTLTLNSAIILTDEQRATITSKNWTLIQ